MENEEGAARLIVNNEGKIIASGNVATKIDSGGGKAKPKTSERETERKRAIESLRNNPGPETPPTPPPMRKIVISKEDNI